MIVKSSNVDFTSYRFSNAKKCTNEGRALMQLDYQQFLMKLDSIMDLKYARLLVKIIEKRSMIDNHILLVKPLLQVNKVCRRRLKDYLLLYIACFHRPIPEKEFVEGYIKAYYLPESQLDSWLQDHKVLVSDILLKGKKGKINKAS